MTYQHLGPYSDWLDAARPAYVDGPALDTAWTRARVREVLNVGQVEAEPRAVRVERGWVSDGLSGEEVSWSVGYGPRTHAYVLRPAEATDPLPGVVALHCHSGFKYFGKEKIADGPGEVSGPAPEVTDLRNRIYGGRAFANALARKGFVVLAHDAFLWGSRRFPLDVMPDGMRDRAQTAVQAGAGEIAGYNTATGPHEHLVEKYCAVLGTTLAAVVGFEDRVAVSYLRSRSDVRTDAIGCVGLSGGGCRSALLYATCDDVRAAAIVGMMSDYEGLLDHNVASHTWMFFPAGLARHCDWPDLAACRAPAPLLVQYDREDQLFTPQGMRAADERVRAHYDRTARPYAYVGQWYDGPHKFDVPMQAAAFDWLASELR